MPVQPGGGMKVPEITAALSKGKGARFANVTYRSVETGELAKYRVLLGTDTRALYEKDVDTLAALTPSLTGVAALAAAEVMKSLVNSIMHMVNGTPNTAYSNTDVRVDVDGLPGVWLHKDTGVLYMQCLVEDKTVIEPGEYKKVNSSPKTIAKREIEKNLRKSKIRTFVIKSVSRIAANGEVIEVECA